MTRPRIRLKSQFLPTVVIIILEFMYVQRYRTILDGQTDGQTDKRTKKRQKIAVTLSAYALR